MEHKWMLRIPLPDRHCHPPILLFYRPAPGLGAQIALVSYANRLAYTLFLSRMGGEEQENVEDNKLNNGWIECGKPS